MRDRLSALFLVWTALAACDSSPPTNGEKSGAPAPAKPEVAKPAAEVTKAVAEAKAPAPPVAGPPGMPDAEAKAPAKPTPPLEPGRLYPAGVVPDNEHASEKKDVPVPLLDRIGECEHEPTLCEYPVGVLGFHADGRVATIVANKLPTCGEDLPPGLAGRVAKQDTFDSGPKKAFPADRNDNGSTKAYKWVAARAAEGFKPPAYLVAFTGEEISGIRGVTSLNGLRAPLAGWMVHATDEAIRLVDPANKTAYELGKTYDGQPSLEQVVLNPERTHLFVTMSFSDGSHCGEDPVSIFRYALPAAAVSAAP